MAELMTSRVKILIIFAVIFLLGVPVWWKTTQTYRTSMPLAQMEQLAKSVESNQSEWKISLRVHHYFPVGFLHVNEVHKGLKAAFAKPFFVGEVNASPLLKLELTDFAKLPDTFTPQNLQEKGDETLDELALSYLETTAKLNLNFGVFDVFVIPSAVKGETKVILGKHRHAIFRSSDLGDIDKLVSNIAEAALVNFKDTDVIQAQRSAEELNIIRMKLAPSYRFIFLLANNNPAAIHGWEIKDAIPSYFGGVLERISVFTNVSVESKVVHYAQIDAAPKFSPEGKYHYFTKENLPYFIDRNSWGVDLDSMSTLPTLYFALYVPQPDQSPLKVVLSNGNIATSNGFLVPQWGGVVIHDSNSSKAEGAVLTLEGLQRVFGVWLTQLRESFGVPSAASKSSYLKEKLGQATQVTIVPSVSYGFSAAESDLVTLRRLLLSERAAAETFMNFVNLMEKLPTIPVEDYIGDYLRGALDSLKTAISESLRGDYLAALRSSSESLFLAEKAFFDRNMLSMLFFPEDHKFAIYIPLFLPIAYPIVFGLFREIKRYMQKRKEEKAKKDAEEKAKVKED